jgi:hypothetical protein
MSERIGWLPIVAVTALLGTPMMPAVARDGARASSVGPVSSVQMRLPFASAHRHIRMRHIITDRVRHDFPRRHAVARHFAPVAILPYAYSVEAVPVERPVTRDEAAGNPYVVAISRSTSDVPEPTTAPAMPPDYSYVPGCVAIPNGYHCKTPPKEVPRP